MTNSSCSSCWGSVEGGIQPGICLSSLPPPLLARQTRSMHHCLSVVSENQVARSDSGGDFRWRNTDTFKERAPTDGDSTGSDMIGGLLRIVRGGRSAVSPPRGAVNSKCSVRCGRPRGSQPPPKFRSTATNRPTTWKRELLDGTVTLGLHGNDDCVSRGPRRAILCAGRPNVRLRRDHHFGLFRIGQTFHLTVPGTNDSEGRGG